MQRVTDPNIPYRNGMKARRIKKYLKYAENLENVFAAVTS